MRKNIKLAIMITTLLVTLFASSYFINRIYILNSKNSNTEVETAINTNNGLDEKIKVSLSKGLVTETEKSLSELKKELGLEGEVTEKLLSSALSEKGYVLTEASKNVIYYNRTIVPNKYYIMEYKDSLAIYKSDENYELIIENESEDVYDSSKKYSHLPEVDRKRMQDYEMEYDTKLKAEEAVSELIS